MIQLTLDFGEQKRNPLSCPHMIRTAYSIKDGEVLCGLKETETFTNCHASIAGEPPHCVWEPMDNSQEAVTRRLKWMKENE